MREFIALSPKVHAYEQVNVDKIVSEEKKARGTNKAVTKKTLWALITIKSVYSTMKQLDAENIG